jgi:3-oxoacyl-[acyl-carrier-protein] synthase-3
MGTVIKSCFTTPLGPASAIGMAVLAARNCLSQVHMPVQDIDLLINVGVFRDNNMIEPAIAPLIQQQLGMNLDPVKNNHLHRSTLAFDMSDGECGFLTAACVVDSFFKTGAAKNALIVAGDIHPSKADHPDFPFQPVAAAILLAYSDDNKQGFTDFHFKTSANGCHGFSANVDLSLNATGNRERIKFVAADHYHDLLLEFASGMMGELAAQEMIRPRDIDYLIASQHSKEFGRKIARLLNLNGRSHTVDLNGQYGDAHTSALPFCYHQLADSGRLQRNQNILFVAADSGLSAACSLYVV